MVPWTAEEKRRYEARFGPGSVELQVLDFVKAVGGIADDATGSFITNIHRALMSKKLMANFGLEKDRDGRVLAWFPAAEIKKSLTKIVTDMQSGAVNSRDLNGPIDRENYFQKFKKGDLPDPKSRLAAPESLDDLAAGLAAGGGRPKPRKRKQRPAPGVRTTLIPKECALNPSSTRLSDIVRELKSLNLNDYSNACSVLLRVFLELSIDDAIESRKHLSNVAGDVLAKKLKAVASDLFTNDQISSQLRKAIDNIANSQTNLLAAGVFAWHQYVHNQYVHPKATELRQTWDELQPFMLALWP